MQPFKNLEMESVRLLNLYFALQDCPFTLSKALNNFLNGTRFFNGNPSPKKQFTIFYLWLKLVMKLFTELTEFMKPFILLRFVELHKQ